MRGWCGSGTLCTGMVRHWDPLGGDCAAVGSLCAGRVLQWAPLSGAGAAVLAVIHISDPTRGYATTYAGLCLKKKKTDYDWK